MQILEHKKLGGISAISKKRGISIVLLKQYNLNTWIFYHKRIIPEMEVMDEDQNPNEDHLHPHLNKSMHLILFCLLLNI